MDGIIALYQQLLPEIVRSEHALRRGLSREGNHFIYRKEGERIIGVSVVRDGVVGLFLVDEAYQKRGIGTSMLEEIEAHVKAAGFDKIKFYQGGFMPGIPTKNNAHEFFIKRGYVNSWGENNVLDMSMMLEDFTWDEHKTGDTIDGVLYRFAVKDDIEGIVKCCEAGASYFSRFYQGEERYKPESLSKAIVAVENGEIAAAVMIGPDGTKESLGTLGCTVTAPKFRGRGLASTLVKLGTRYMKEELGVKEAWLAFTHTGIANVYYRSGYKILMEYYMGEKVLTAKA
jgi:GNAT superfamily N-acetyltransferase